ncbi:MAG: hypothetical protein FWD22_01290 [Treponema sp.]|nr:hypothetical protein [Treponema sp.]
MKIRMTVIAIAISAIFFVGCAGTPVSVDRFGGMQPVNQGFGQMQTKTEQSGYELAEFVPNAAGLMIDPFGFNKFNNVFGISGIQDSMASMTHFPLFILDNSMSRFVFNNYWSNQNFVASGSLFNPDCSITLLSAGKVQFKLMPATFGRS